MNTKHKHVPQRTCVVCREKTNKRTLTRFVRTDAGVFSDPKGKQAGRGAYVCDSEECRTRAVTTDVLARALKTALTDADRQRVRDAES